MVEYSRQVLQDGRREQAMSEEVKKCCPFIHFRDKLVMCGESDCMAWREIDHNDWDCVLLRNKQ